MASKWKSCKACGNRYPESDGVGPNSEFCCEGCWETWEANHPGYTAQKNNDKKYERIGYVLFFAVLLVVFLWKCVLTN
jgi:hypothetical protein